MRQEIENPVGEHLALSLAFFSLVASGFLFDVWCVQVLLVVWLGLILKGVADVFGAQRRCSQLWVLIAICLSSGYALVLVLNQSRLPVFGWDSLDYWLREAASSMSLAENTAVLEIDDLFAGIAGDRHPPTLVKIFVSAASLGGIFGAQPTTSLGLVYLGVVLHMWILICRYASTLFELAPARYLALFFALFFGSPLLENHYHLIGYADIWMAVAVLEALAASSTLIARGPTPLVKLMSFPLIATPLLIKNMGAVYGLLISLSLALVYFEHRAKANLVRTCSIIFTTLIFLTAVLLITWQTDSVFTNDQLIKLRSTENGFGVEISECDFEPSLDYILVKSYVIRGKESQVKLSDWEKSKFPGAMVDTIPAQDLILSGGEAGCWIDVLVHKDQFDRYEIIGMNQTNGPLWHGVWIPDAYTVSIPAIGFGAQISSTSALQIGGNWGILGRNSAADVSSNFLTAFVSNSSFSLISVIILIAFFGYRELLLRTKIQIVFLTITGLSAFGAQYFLSTAYRFSAPGSDTGFSRLVLFVFPIVILICIDLLGLSENAESHAAKTE